MQPRYRQLAAISGIMLVIATSIWGLSASADLDLTRGDAAQVAYTDGDGVNVRDTAGPEGGLLATLPDGWPVTIVAGPSTAADGSSWYSIVTRTDTGTVSGWMLADYLTRRTIAAGGSTSLPSPSASPASTPADPSGDVAIGVISAGSGLNLRAGPTTSDDVLDVIPDGAAVDVLAPAVVDEQGIAWSQVRYDGIVGYSASAYLGIAGEAEADSPADIVVGRAFLIPGARAVVAGTAGDWLNVRAEPDAGADSLTTLPDGALVAIVDGPSIDALGDVWFQIQAGDTLGWVHAGYLAGMSPAGADALAANASDLAARSVAGALAYLGVPYAAEGTTPDGFDGPGFVAYVFDQLLAVDLPGTLDQQATAGSEAALGDLAPGDLLFFQNTDRTGLSHVGIYLGGNQFISAASETGAVDISSLNDPYWRARYVTARRVE